jgi:glycosyltransferase involved in cell wall biosynthesis
MRALVLSLLQPPRPGVDVHGTYKRLPLHVHALHAIGAKVEIAYYVTEEDVPVSMGLDTAARAQEMVEEKMWGFPTKVHLIRRRHRPQTFLNYYLKGIFNASEQPSMAPWAGPEQAAAVGALLDTGFDIVVVNNMQATCAVVRSGRRPNRLFFDMDDVQHLVRLRFFRQAPTTPGNLLMIAHLPAMFAAERKAARLAEATFVCSQKDREHLVAWGFPRVAVIPNAVEIPHDSVGKSDTANLLFVGGMGHEPNREAAERMIKSIFPLIRRERPDARLIIVGKGSEALPSRSTFPPDVEYLGFVEDIASLYRKCAIFVCPMINGGGTRIKLLDAAAYGLPIVSTTMGAEGISLQNEHQVLLRETDREFAKGCLDLLADPARAHDLGQAGREAIRKAYDAQMVEETLARKFRGNATAAV